MFIWTEAFNCGELLDPFLKSYLTHNSHPIHVYCRPKDMQLVTVDSNLVEFHVFDKNEKEKRVLKKILNFYRYGHKGTAEFWTYLILSRKENYFLHLDADTIFLGEVVSTLMNPMIKQGYTLVGSRRPYKNRTYRLHGLDAKLLNKRPDTVNTDCFAFDKSKIRKMHRNYLRRRIQGKRTSFMPVVDYFDPISFQLIKKYKVLYLDSPSDGFSSQTNFDSDFMQQRISFSAVGSGINFYKNPDVSIPTGYRSYALASFSLYSKYILGQVLEVEHLSHEDLENKLIALDKEHWILNK